MRLRLDPFLARILARQFEIALSVIDSSLFIDNRNVKPCQVAFFGINKVGTGWRQVPPNNMNRL